ncbi:MAG: hypothetical protein IT376_20640 [Polyangiaceae bacterium]|nr:hypothetical protein [Polyangiaceae bacterium]
MNVVRARVQGGRLVLDEPTRLPEGAEVQVALLDADSLEGADRAALHAAIEASEAELDSGRVVAEAELWARLRALR